MSESNDTNSPVKRKFFLSTLGFATTPVFAAIGQQANHLETGVLAGSVVAAASLLANAKSNSTFFNAYAKGAATGAVLSVLGVGIANSIDIETSDKAVLETSAITMEVQ